jgi:predicted NBD/HSP70 family sugar kinase
MGVRIGIDLGGTKIEALALDEAGCEIVRKRVPTPRNDYGGTVSAIRNLVRDMEGAQKGTYSVGIGIPGALSRVTGLVKNANSTWLNGKPLKQDLEKALGREVRIANDANCFALSEAVDGAGKDARVVFGVILGTGVGGGISVEKRIHEGVNAIAGEWGHNPLPLPRQEDLPLRPCYCGRKGCIETYLCGPALEKEGDLDRYEERLARALASVINVLDPGAIVLGGGVSNVARLYDNVPRRWAQFVFSDAVATRLLPPTHGDASGVRGAAWLWPRAE